MKGLIVLGLVLILLAIIFAILDAVVVTPQARPWLLNASVVMLAVGVVLIVQPSQLGFTAH